MAFQAPGRPRPWHRGTTPGGHRGSQVSKRSHQHGHVARERKLPGGSPYVQGSRPGIVSPDVSGISGDRNQKPPLTRQRPLFAVRRRLRADSPASPCGPFMVELFAAGCFPRTPGWSGPVAPLTERELPTPARVERTRARAKQTARRLGREPPRDGFAPFPRSRPPTPGGVSLSPRLRAGARTAIG